MFSKESIAKRCQAVSISWFDLVVISTLLIGGFIYMHDPMYWGIAYIGETQYGDAHFWWNGAIHIAQGVFQDNPGKGYRAGYFILTGLALPVLGMEFHQYYPYFLLVFLSTACLFYLALRQPLSRWAAAGVVCMLIFNPYTAEWITTSTTDGTGLLLNVAALSCLLFGLNNGLHRKWLIGFSMLFALGSLTRPLLTPYIGIVVLIILLYKQLPIKRRLIITFAVVTAFCLPTLLWMATQKLTIDRWALSANDATAIYAASDPTIQVWNPTVEGHIRELAAERFRIKPEAVTNVQINDVYWQEIVANYVKYRQYHIDRIIPHLLLVANFSPKLSTHGSNFWQIVFLEAIALGLMLWLLLTKSWFRALLLALAAMSIYLEPANIAYLTLAGMFSAFIIRRHHKVQLGILLLSLYWLAGVATLYVSGASMGPPLTNSFLNALGYRLGSQVFFIGDLLAGYFLVWIAFFASSTASQQHQIGILSRLQQFGSRPALIAGGIVITFYSVIFTAIITVYVAGSLLVIERAYNRTHTPVKPYPSLTNIVSSYQHKYGNVPIVAKEMVGSAVGEPNAVIFTGTVSTFIWNQRGQERAQILIYLQDKITPATIGPSSLIVDVPQHLKLKDWVGAQGAFIIRNAPDNHIVSNLPYYITKPALLAFIPLAPDKSSFAIDKTIWFKTVKNATQLETSQVLRFPHTNVTWATDSGAAPFKRRFFLLPQMSDKVELALDVSNTRGNATLKFSYALGDAQGQSQPSTSEYADIKMMTTTLTSEKLQPILPNRVRASTETDSLLKHIELPIPANTKSVIISFNNIKPKMGIWIYEFNLSAADFMRDTPINNLKHG